MRFWLLATTVLCGTCAGCGTTKMSDTTRTATEQLLISDAMDRAVSRLDFRALAAKNVYLDTVPIQGSTDAAYLTSSLRQHMLASGCILRNKQEEADYVVEARAGAVGTDRHELLFGVPATNLPSVIPLTGVPSSVPEIPFAKKTEQRAVSKIALFAYNRKTGRPVWQSGIVSTESKAKDVWVLGAGPFRRGSIYEGTNFAGGKINIPLLRPGTEGDGKGVVSVADEAYFVEPKVELAQLEDKVATKGDSEEPKSPKGDKTPPKPPEVVHADHQPSPPTAEKPPATVSALPLLPDIRLGRLPLNVPPSPSENRPNGVIALPPIPLPESGFGLDSAADPRLNVPLNP